MTGTRQTFVFALESSFSNGKDGSAMDGKWYVPPPGSVFTSSHNRSITRINEVGRKIWSDYAYTKMSGTWEWSFVLDYNYLEPLLLYFTDYEFSIYDGGIPDWNKHGQHTFTVSELGVTRPFTVRRKILHHIAGGPADEMDQLLGCVCTSFRMSQAGGASQIQVTMSGIYADEVMNSDADLELDVFDKTPAQLEFACIKDEEEKIIGIVQNWSLQSKNNIQTLYSVGNSCARTYYEDELDNNFSVTIYANNPKLIKQRVYSGGVHSHSRAPQMFDMGPMSALLIKSHAGDCCGSSISRTILVDDVEYTVPENSMTVSISDCVINSVSWESGMDTPLMDRLTSANCRTFTLTFVNGFPCSYDEYDVRKESLWASHLVQ